MTRPSELVSFAQFLEAEQVAASRFPDSPGLQGGWGEHIYEASSQGTAFQTLQTPQWSSRASPAAGLARGWGRRPLPCTESASLLVLTPSSSWAGSGHHLWRPTPTDLGLPLPGPRLVTPGHTRLATLEHGHLPLYGGGLGAPRHLP